MTAAVGLVPVGLVGMIGVGPGSGGGIKAVSLISRYSCSVRTSAMWPRLVAGYGTEAAFSISLSRKW